MLFSMPFIVIVDAGIYFQTLNVKPLIEENIKKATAILTNLIYEWNFKFLTSRLLQHTIKGNMPLKIQTVNIWKLLHSVCMRVCMHMHTCAH